MVMIVRRNSMLGACAGAALLLAGVTGSSAAENAGSPAVVELFTSQGCYSCPPAEAYLGELSKRADVIALEFHVDYWDDLVYGSAGKWKDPFSSAKHTERQRRYNNAIRKKNGVYTPQMVIGGILETVGSQEDKVEKAIKIIGQTRASPLSVELEKGAGGALDIRVTGPEKTNASIWIVWFLPNVETIVRSGENKGKTLISHNIVTAMERVGEWRGEPVSLNIHSASDGRSQGCAVIVQAGQAGPVLGASYCPDNRAS